MLNHDFLEIDQEKCSLCGTCVENCPEDALAISQQVLVIEKPEACTVCGFCEETCPEGAIAIRYQIVWQQ